jgi:hypothetical protein
MKLVILAISLLIGTSAFAAKNSDACLEVLTKKYQTEAKQSSDWGYEGISSLTNAQAKDMIKTSLTEDGPKKRAKMQALLNDKDISFYAFQWNAPSNTGITILAVDKASCNVIADLLHWSEE